MNVKIQLGAQDITNSIFGCLDFYVVNMGVIFGDFFTIIPSFLIVEKFVKRKGNCNRYEFLSKSSWTTFKTILENLSALRVYHLTIIEGVV